MNIFVLRAKDFTAEREYHKFTIADAPCIIDDGRIATLSRPHSPILDAENVDLGSDVGVFVGDIVQDPMDKTLWIVSYNLGFLATNLDTKAVRTFLDFKNIKFIRRGSQEERERYRVDKQGIYFKWRDIRFGLRHVVGLYKDHLIITKVRDLVPITEVQQDLNMSIDDERLFLGDRYKGYPVIMCYGRICVQTTLGAYDILHGEYILK